MPKSLVIIGAPSSAGAYSPGQEKAPDALRTVGIIDALQAQGLFVHDRGNTRRERWQADRKRPDAMNLDAVAAVAGEVAEETYAALEAGHAVLVLGGDCTVELGTVAGARRDGAQVGLVYFDLDADLNTPSTTSDGALDWMGVAHMLGISGTERELVEIGTQRPLLNSDSLLLFGFRNMKPCERSVVDELGIKEIHGDQVAADPASAAREAVIWSARFDRLLIHFDVDAIDYEDFPLAENIRRKLGLSFQQAMAALAGLVQAPNFAGLTVTEINPDHGEPDGATLQAFSASLAEALGKAPALGGNGGAASSA